MKLCNNPDCIAYKEQRLYNESDRVCANCGQPLVAAGPAPATTIRQSNAPAADQPSGPVAVLLGLLLLLLVMGGVWWFSNLFKTGPQTAPPTDELGTPVPPIPAVLTAQAEATRAAIGTMLPRTPILDLPTPVGGGASSGAPLSQDDAGATATAVIALIQSNGGATGGAAASQPGAGATATAVIALIQSNGGNIVPAQVSGTGGSTGVSAVILCKRFAPAQSCEPTSDYTSRDAFNVAVLAPFGSGATTSALVRWYGPDGGLLFVSDPVTPTRAGTFWVGFTLTQSQPWRTGNYYAVIYLDGAPQYPPVVIPVVP